ncbi:MAG: Methionyl-tRNA Fmet Formyltransferase Chain domain 2 [Moraxellaceae bacterium]|nr:Methionyl-tRNA Fmet Formyltransferase Chain domain 2 [Moraxellaceae bacterium]
MDHPLRIVFAGTPEFAAESLKALLQQGEHEVIAVYTQPDRPAGRGRELKASPVKELALSRRIPVFQPPSLKDPVAVAELEELKPDLMIVAAYGLILPRTVLAVPRLGCLNVHASLLPRWRGAAPIQRAILAGDRETGITIMQMEEGLDTGPMRYTVRCPISPNDTAASLHDRLALLGGEALVAALELLNDGALPSEPQDSALATYATKLSKEEARLDWQRSAAELSCAVRAYNPVPVAFSTLNGQTVRIWEASDAGQTTTAPPGMIIAADRDGLRVAAGEGTVLMIETLQLPGGKPLAVLQLLNARRDQLAPGQMLGA